MIIFSVFGLAESVSLSVGVAIESKHDQGKIISGFLMKWCRLACVWNCPFQR